MGKKAKGILSTIGERPQAEDVSAALAAAKSDPVPPSVRVLDQSVQIAVNADDDDHNSVSIENNVHVITNDNLSLSARLALFATKARGEAQAALNSVLVELQMARHKASTAPTSEEIFSSDELALLQEIAEL